MSERTMRLAFLCVKPKSLCVFFVLEVKPTKNIQKNEKFKNVTRGFG